jgi:class 3 adenylate cyclase
MAESHPDALSELRALREAGRHIEAFDRARALLETDQRSATLLHFAALSLARCGAPAQAARLLDRHPDLCRDDDEEIASLKARLLKDHFRLHGDPESGRASRDLYLATFQETGGYFPAINAATLSLLLGEGEQACALAADALKRTERVRPAEYWPEATRAEALLILGKFDEAAKSIASAARLPDAHPSSRNSTFRQFRLLRAPLGFPDSLLDPIRPAAIAAFSGHMIHGMGRSPGIDPDDTAAVGRQVEEVLRRERVGFGFGSLACGADILVAEALLRCGAELTVVLPFAAERFIATSVAPGGKEWIERFQKALAAATRQIVLAQEPITGFSVLYDMAGRVAMGSARLKAVELEADVVQLAVRHDGSAVGAAGTGRDVATWAAGGGRTILIEPPAPRRGVQAPAKSSDAVPPRVTRAQRAMVFSDVRGYSALSESRQALLVPRWLDAVNALRARHGEKVSIVETWGDAAYFVTTTLAAAAEIACELAALTGRQLLPETEDASSIGLRVSAHAGPVLVTDNAALRQQAYFGADVNLAARMEPCAPVGEVYVTETFAALLMMESGHRFQCEYVGIQQLAKKYGELRMFHLRRIR